MIYLLIFFSLANFAFADIGISSDHDQVKSSRKIDIIEANGLLDVMDSDITTNGRIDASNLQVDDLALQYIDGPIDSLQDLSNSINNQFGNIIQGLLQANVIAQTGEVQTTTTNDVLLNGMTTTPSAGQYIVLGFVNNRHQSSNGETFYSLYAGGVQVPNTLYSVRRGAQQGDVTSSWFASSKLNLNGSQAVDIRWRSQSGTAQSFGRYLILLRIGS